MAPSSSCNDLNHCRTTWNIAWSCLLTILMCSWVAIHPNIPGSNEKWSTITLRRLRLMVIALTAPEMIIYFAMRQRVTANKLRKNYSLHGWTLTHGFFAVMGGFALVENSQISCTLGVDVAYDPGDPVIENYIHEIDISEADINDRSKGDILSKGLVVIQTGWFVVQCIARRVTRIPITELEIVTVAFAVLNFFTYILWWNKPLNVQCAVRVVASSQTRMRLATMAMAPSNTPTEKTMVGVIRKHGLRRIMTHVLHDWLLSTISGGGSRTAWDAKRAPTFYAGDLTEGQIPAATVAAGLTAIIFGAIHCLAWSFHFPSQTEQLLWRISSLVIACMPMLLTVTRLTGDYVRLNWSEWILPIEKATILVSVILYIVARLSLLVLALISLRSLPPGAYETVHWTTFIPHV